MMLDIEYIPAKAKEHRITRVAAYARVSTDKDAAFHSLEAQTDYYEYFVNTHPDWELVGIYSDDGISGTTTKRPEFQRMLGDCRAGKVDLVITKSITRFARNTVILLETVRELKTLGIDCYFEKEDLHSISPDGELILTLLAMYAEEEARSASENQKWRIQKLYDEGKPASGHTYGYQLTSGRFEIVPEEAKIVQRIFRLYLSGMGIDRIAKQLNAEGIPSPFEQTWANTTLRQILTNEKYCGDLLLQKSFSEDFRTKKLRKNTGELRQVYVKNAHAAIIDSKTFDAAQAEIAIRRTRYSYQSTHPSKAKVDSSDLDDNLFSGLIGCGYCGSKYQRKRTHAKPVGKTVWICQKYFRYGTAVCKSQRIPEDILIDKTKEVLGIDTLTRGIVTDRITRICVPEHNRLVYELQDGSTADIHWEHISRSASWTADMRKKAGEHAKKRKRREN